MPSPVSRDDDEIDLMQLFGVLWRGRWIISTFALVAVLIGGYYAYRIAVPMYPAQVTIALQNQQQQVIGDIESIFAGGGTDTNSINTEFEVIRSRRLIGALVDELDLVSDPEFNGSLRQPSLRTRITNTVLGGEPPAPLPPEIARSRVIDALRGRISVSSIRQSFAFNIGITTTSSEKSTLIVNTLADLYIVNQVQQKLEATEQAIEFLSRRTTELEANVEALEQTLTARSEESDVIRSEFLQARNLQLRDLRSRIVDLEAGVASTEAEISLLDGANDAQELVSRLERVDDTRATVLLQEYRTGRLSDDAFIGRVEEYQTDQRRDVARAQQQLAGLRSSEQDLAAQIRQQSEDFLALQQLEREVNAARLLYETFFTRLQEASVQQGLETADARVLSEAVPRGPSSPQRQRILMLSAILGAMLGAGLVLIREWRFTGFRTSDELRRETGQRILGSVPRLKKDDRRFALEHMKTKPNSVFAEAVRNLRTSILMSNIDKEPQVILLTSSVPNEGKTTLSIALTRYLRSMEGKRSLLLEADIRRKILRAYVDNEPKIALMDVLLSKVPTENIDLYNEELGIEVLAGSEVGGNAADLFASRRFNDLIKALRQEFDYIVIDSPPVLAVPDARVLASYADAVVFVVKWASTTKTQVEQGIEMLQSVDAKITGMILSGVDQNKMKSYGYKGQYGYDGYSRGYYGEK
jgi:capsular exopolysaccharide synthesis family protein